MGNGNVNDRGKIISSSAAPRDTSMGKSTAKDATNVVGGTKVSTTPLSPYACTPNK